MPPRAPDFELFPVLDSSWAPDGIGPIAALIAQLPDPSSLPTGGLIVVRDSGPPSRGIRRLVHAIGGLWKKPRRAHASVRCTALLARGYREIAASTDPRTGEELVWALAPTSDRSS
jgi:hypothetical protein